MLVFWLSFFQTVTFVFASRARNRDHTGYNLAATFVGNIAWFLCFKEVTAEGWDAGLLWYYALGATLGSGVGVWLSKKIEILLNAKADGHIP